MQVLLIVLLDDPLGQLPEFEFPPVPNYGMMKDYCVQMVGVQGT